MDPSPKPGEHLLLNWDLQEEQMSLKKSDEFKNEAVQLALTSGLSRKQVTADLGIGLSTFAPLP